ncbi:ATP-binding protein [Sphingomonas sp. MA1305]|uniref:ATP-dependent nuclease n=1 Tax=Sphingomonas sp. MA1305 TaxID=2479204 RepID=UPI001E3D257D|nr:AAA family ATPase [Sphingomonas sp. MA1305]MBI0475005.1 ATP-binding protein [Sphingomonas sp. MA1305]
MFLKALQLKNYRGIGPEWISMPSFKRFNFFIGANNSGKSIALNFISKHLPYPNGERHLSAAKLDDHELHLVADQAGFKIGNPAVEVGNRLKAQLNHRTKTLDISVDKLIAALSDDDGVVWLTAFLPAAKAMVFDPAPRPQELLSAMSREEWYSLWRAATGREGADVLQHCIPQLVMMTQQAVDIRLPPTRLIPAIRQIRPATDADIGGAGLIDRLIELQNPDVFNMRERKKFHQINSFLQFVTDEETAAIEIPHHRQHILVKINNKILPLENLGSGIHEVVIIAAECILHDYQIVCIEEPELHLHPLLQRKLMQFLSKNTNNQYFIATHSASFIDTPDSAIFHVTSTNGRTSIKEAMLRAERHAICVDLGHRASDIIQANAVIWVEGPSDRIYLQNWIRLVAPDIQESIHYSIMFYGGRLLSHLSASDDEVSEFIELRALNRNLAIMIDSDRTSPYSRINETKKRILAEFRKDGAVGWLTKGREVENYIDHATLQQSVKQVYGTLYDSPLAGGQYDHALHFTRTRPTKYTKKPIGGLRATANLVEEKVDKVKVARSVVALGNADLNMLDLRDRVQELVAMIRRANA